MAASGQPSEIPQLVALIKTMTIPQLKDLLRNEGLALSGVKAVLQLRIIDCSFPPSLTGARSPWIWHFCQLGCESRISPEQTLTMRTSQTWSVFATPKATASATTP